MPSSDRIIAQIVGQAWADDAFRRRLLADPAAVMREYGLDVPADVRVVMHENTRETRHVVLPQMPEDFESGASVLQAILGRTHPFFLFLPRRGGGKKGGGRKGGGRKRTR